MLHPAFSPLSAPPSEPAGPPTLLDMEARLRDDTDGRYRADLQDQLAASRREVVRQLDLGVAPDEYQRLTKLCDALDAAARVIESFPPASGS